MNNALNEVCHGLDIGEFHTRMDAKREEVIELLAHIRPTLDQVQTARHQAGHAEPDEVPSAGVSELSRLPDATSPSRSGVVAVAVMV